MKRKILIIILMCAAAAALRAKGWETATFDGRPLYTQLEVYRSGQDITYQYRYDYRDSTFHVLVYPDARVLAAVKNAMDNTPVRPAFVEVTIRFKGCPDGNRKFTYHLTNPNPDGAQIVSQGFFDNIVKDDGNILSHMRSCQKMEVRYGGGLYTPGTISLSLKDFEGKNSKKSK